MLLACNTVELPGNWTGAGITADGKRGDWDDIPFHYFEKQKAVLAMCNDSSHLNIYFSFNDPSWLQSIRMSGLTLWFDNQGKKHKNIGLVYRGGTPPRPDSGGGPGGDKPSRFDSDQKKQMFPGDTLKTPQLTLIDKDNDFEFTAPVDGGMGPKAAFGETNGIYTYEFSIPLAPMSAGFFGIDAQPGATVCIGVEWGKIEMKQMSRPSKDDDFGGPPRGGGPGGMGGSPPGGGMGPGGGGMGPGGGMSGGQPSMPEEQKIWIKTVLAKPTNVADKETAADIY